jgi:hypothetical protein
MCPGNRSRSYLADGQESSSPRIRPPIRDGVDGRFIRPLGRFRWSSVLSFATSGPERTGAPRPPTPPFKTAKYELRDDEEEYDAYQAWEACTAGTIANTSAALSRLAMSWRVSPNLSLK